MASTLASLEIAISANTAAVTTGLRSAERGMNRFKNVIKSVGGVMAAAFSARAIGGLTKDLVAAFAQQEEAVESLRAALETTGRGGSAALQMLTRQASELQRVTTKGDEAIIAASASFAQLATALSPEELGKAQKAIIGIADTFLKGDLQSAALLVGKSISSSTNALTRYGIEVDTTASQSEKLAQIMEQSAGMFEVSQARAETLAGRMQQFKNAVGDLKETLGGLLVDLLGLTDRSANATQVVFDMIDAVEKNRGVIIAWGKVIFAAGETAWGVFRLIVRTAKNMTDIIGENLRNVGDLLVGIFTLDLDRIKSAISAIKDTVVYNLQDIGDEIGNLKESFEDLILASQMTGAGNELFGGPRRRGRAAAAPFVTPQQMIDKFKASIGELPDVVQAATDSMNLAIPTVRTMADTVSDSFGYMANTAIMKTNETVRVVIGMLSAIGRAVWEKQSQAFKDSDIGTALGGFLGALSFQRGGIVPGSPHQAVPIIAHGGERVLPAGHGEPTTINQYFVYNVQYRDQAEFFRQHRGIMAGQVVTAIREVPALQRAIVRGG